MKLVSFAIILFVTSVISMSAKNSLAMIAADEWEPTFPTSNVSVQDMVYEVTGKAILAFLESE